jgi:hypothetical protein
MRRAAVAASVSRSNASVASRRRVTELTRVRVAYRPRSGYGGTWKTQSAPASSCHGPGLDRSPRTGTAPLDRSSAAAAAEPARADTRCPRSASTLTRALPMNPSAPVTKVVSAVPPVMSQFSDGTESQTTDTTRTRLVRQPHVHAFTSRLHLSCCRHIDPCSQPGIFRSIPRLVVCATRVSVTRRERYHL